MTRLLVALALLASALAWPGAAAAAFPGANGDFVLSLSRCDDPVHDGRLVALPWRGGPIRSLTPSCPGAEGDTIGSYLSPDPAPDGSGILAVESNATPGYVLFAADGTVRRRLPLPRPGGRPIAWDTLSAPSFAPDGRRFAFAGSRGAIWTASTEGGEHVPLLRCGRTPSGGRAFAPRWSPDGRRIAITVTYPGCRTHGRRLRSGVWLVRAADGRPVRRIAGDHAAGVDWSPDGRSLVYTTNFKRDDSTGYLAGGNLFVVSRDGRRTRKLVHRHDRAETEPVWSPDGRSIAWVGLDMGAGDVSPRIDATLWRVPARGGEPVRIRPLPRIRVEEGEWYQPQLAWLPEPSAE